MSENDILKNFKKSRTIQIDDQDGSKVSSFYKGNEIPHPDYAVNHKELQRGLSDFSIVRTGEVATGWTKLKDDPTRAVPTSFRDTYKFTGNAKHTVRRLRFLEG